MTSKNKETITWTISSHAKQRAWERYDVMFSPQKWVDFCNTMQKGKYSICLGSDGSGSRRFACYFQKRWFLVGCSMHGRVGIISTFLPADALTETDKTILQSDDRYSRIADDTWNIMSQRLLDETGVAKRANRPAMHISQEELPKDFDQVCKLLEKNVLK